MSKYLAKIKLFFILILFSIISDVCTVQEFAFAARKEAGRFGNQLYLYSLAQYLSFKYNKLFFYRPFEYSDQLCLHTDEKNSIYENKCKRILIKKERNIFSDLQAHKEDILFLCGCKTYIDHKPSFMYCDKMFEQIFDIIAQQPQVLSLLRSRIQPIISIPELQNNGLPSIALHIRTGGNFIIDNNWVEKLKEIKYQKNKVSPRFFQFVQLLGYEFYFQAIKLILRKLKNRACFIYIFTDDSHPERIADIFKEKFRNEPIIFDYHRSNIVQDFFMMMKCDYLVRGYSTFSMSAQMLGNYKKVIYPIDGSIENGKLILKKINIVDSRKKPRIKQIHFEDLR